ncbi:MAG: IS110 family transposase [Acidobacteria bacterium]|nr:IS110 family transposase [Acidobacteriota bacterium]
MLIIGCDFHPSGQQVFCLDSESGEVVKEQWLKHEGDEVEVFYAGLPAGAEVGVETSGNMLWFERKLAKFGHRLRIGDAARISALDQRKQKHDRRSAEHIAMLMANQLFPDLRWVPTLEERDQRQLLLHRHKLVRMRAQVMNQLQHIAMNQGKQQKRKLWSREGRKLLESLVLEPWTARRRDDLLDLLDKFDAQCADLDREVEKAAGANAQACLLRQHPGIGPVISLAYVLTLGDVSRFRHSRQVVSYLGLNPSEASSGERRKLGSISKQGNSFLRWLLVQGAQSAAHKDAELKRQYLRLAARKNKSIAKLMVARKLAVRMFWMLKTQSGYSELLRMRGSSSHSVVAKTEDLSERSASQQAQS